MIRSARTGRWRPLQAPEDGQYEGPSNLPLGIIHPTQYFQFAVHLEPDDLILLYTDSLVEAMDDQGRQLGEEGLIELLNAVPVADLPEMCQSILGAVETHRGGLAPDDDVTLLLIKKT